MPKHIWSVSVKGDSGAGPTISRSVFFSAEQNVGGVLLGQTGLNIGVQDVEEVDLVITVANLKSFYMKCDTDVRVRTNAVNGSGGQEFNFNASEGLAWNNINLPSVVSNPLTINITKLFIFNKGTVDTVTPTAGLKIGSFVAGFGVAQEILSS